MQFSKHKKKVKKKEIESVKNHPKTKTFKFQMRF